MNPEKHGRFIRSVTVNGAPWTSISIPHSLLADGAHIAFELSPTPTGWASDSRPVSASEVHGFEGTPVDLLPVGAHPLADDIGRTAVHLAAGESVDVPVSVEAASLYTVTITRPGRFSWTAALVDVEGRVCSSDERMDELFEWTGQTRVSG